MYDFKQIEKKWKDYWEENKTFATDIHDYTKPKYYALDMFPYPSGVGLHAGHPEGYTATDIVCRMKRMQGYNVLHPMGFDAFGLPAEQYAINTGNHPGEFTKKNIDVFRQQLKNLGFSYDWDREISTCDPKFYKWTQWIFKQLYLDGLVKEVEIPVNWCEELGTVLANDEVINGKSERGGYPVVRKMMKQWVIDMPKYADRLLEGLEEIDWPESTKEMQKNWIGKSEGSIINFNIKNSDEKLNVFTTRVDTLFGVTYCVISPESELIDKLVTDENKQEVEAYVKKSLAKSELERLESNKDKTGVFTGAYAINPANGKEVPIWISDYVLSSYGTGAIMAVPAHDKRDYDFATKYGLDIIPVIKSENNNEILYLEDGIHINSEFLNGLNKDDAINKMNNWLEEKKYGKKATNYKIRDWVFARQRYWGEPIPILHYEDGTTEILSDEELPLVLPKLEDYSPSKDGSSPLNKAIDWVNVVSNGKKAKRETSTMPGSAGSSWYYLRYIDPKNEEKIADYELLKHWMPVDLYIGGPEHTVGHLLYSRMWNNYLFDKGVVPVKEPFKKLVHQGMVLGSNGMKMGKRYPEFAINPNDVIDKYGADTLRLYEMFMGPLETDQPWSNEGVEGSKKFLDRIWRLYIEDNKISNESNKNLEKIYHETVKKVTEDYENLKFNTAISQLMIFINAVSKEKVFPLEYAEGFLKLLNPIAPFITEEINSLVINKDVTIAESIWPTYDEKILASGNVNMVVNINNKKVSVISVPRDLTKEELLDYILLYDEPLENYLSNFEFDNIYFVPNRMINFLTTKDKTKIMKK